MSSEETPLNGYVCAPYLHSHDSIELKDTWSHSKNIEDMYFVTATFSSEKSHQSVNQYCEKTRRDICRKGITMTNLVGLSVLEKLK